MDWNEAMRHIADQPFIPPKGKPPEGSMNVFTICPICLKNKARVIQITSVDDVVTILSMPCDDCSLGSGGFG